MGAVAEKGRHSASDNNQLPPALTPFAPSTPGTTVLRRGAAVDLSNSGGPSTVSAGAGRGNFERYQPEHQGVDPMARGALRE